MSSEPAGHVLCGDTFDVTPISFLINHPGRGLETPTLIWASDFEKDNVAPAEAEGAAGFAVEQLGEETAHRAAGHPHLLLVHGG